MRLALPSLIASRGSAFAAAWAVPATRAVARASAASTSTGSATASISASTASSMARSASSELSWGAISSRRLTSSIISTWSASRPPETAWAARRPCARPPPSTPYGPAAQPAGWEKASGVESIHHGSRMIISNSDRIKLKPWNSIPTPARLCAEPAATGGCSRPVRVGSREAEAARS